MTIDAIKLTAQITAVTTTVTSLITCGREIYPHIITLLSTIRLLINEVASKSTDIGAALVGVYDNIEKIIAELKETLAKEGLVSDNTLESWLTEIDTNIQKINKAAEE